MDFQKIYAEFKAADAKHDLEKMSEIISQINEHCATLSQAGRANKIPQSAIYIAKYINVLIYHTMQLLNNGKGDKVIIYLLSISKFSNQSFNLFFYLRYFLGRALYQTGDYQTAEKIFCRYEEARDEKFGDFDELSMFYRANCCALLGYFNVAAQLYEFILKIKSDFPEVKKNLKLVQSGMNKNLVREVKSLWKFPDWRDVPIFINARDRLGVLKKLIDWLFDAGYRNLIILDNNSTYPLLLEYYSALQKDSRVKIVRLGKNLGYKALWLSGVLEQMKISTPYVYTDPDVLPIERCPKNFVKRLMEILDNNHELRKVGLGLVWEDVTFFDKKETQQRESNFYVGSQVDNNLYYAQVDTTFALYANVRHYSLRFSLRTTGNLMAYHLPWYFDYDNLPDDEKYYMMHTDKNSVTSVRKFLEAT
ncbi:MAG: hypothetical protein IJQ82_13540 [Selenomonadaceae bacterium]|nr:hypothetical protein [Selenomonadaceae bacterium]